MAYSRSFEERLAYAIAEDKAEHRERQSLSLYGSVDTADHRNNASFVRSLTRICHGSRDPHTLNRYFIHPLRLPSLPIGWTGPFAEYGLSKLLTGSPTPSDNPTQGYDFKFNQGFNKIEVKGLDRHYHGSYRLPGMKGTISTRQWHGDGRGGSKADVFIIYNATQTSKRWSDDHVYMFDPDELFVVDIPPLSAFVFARDIFV